MTDDPWPTEIRLNKAKDELSVTFDDGETHSYRAEFLRVLSPSAEVQGHNPSQRQTVPGKKDVTITDIQPTGNYAVRLVFDDGHSTGIYSWKTFTKFAREREALWADYLQRMEEKGLSRER